MAVDNSNWDGSAAMSGCAQSEDPAAAYEAICAGRREGDPALQSTWALPHHREPGMGPNADGVRNSLSRLPQTEGLVNAEAAQRHLDAHMAEIHDAALEADEVAVEASAPGEIRTLDLPEEHLLSFDSQQRRLGLRIVPYDVVAEHPVYGPLLFRKGAFGEVDPKQVRLRMDHSDPPTGLGASFSERADGAYMEFKVSATDRGDEQLTLARDGVSRGASVGYAEVPGAPQRKTVNGRLTTVYGPNSARLAEVSTTWQPTFPEAGVIYALHAQEKHEEAPVAETPEAPTTGAEFDYDRLAGTIASANSGTAEKLDKVLGALDQFMDAQRAQFTIPTAEPRRPKLHHWVEYTLRRFRGESIPTTMLRELALDDVVTTEQPGLVPNLLLPDYDDLINQDRPFLSSTRQVAPPETGTSMLLPIITTRAVAGTQDTAEKGVLTTTATKVGTGTFAYVAVFGGADISIQMIQRAGQSFFDLLTGDMGMAYALDCDSKALTALLTGYTDSASASHVPTSGGVLDPEDPQFGVAWENSIAACKRAPTHIWMSAAAVGAFIDAKAPVTNAPLYSNLAASFTAGGGPGGTLSGLTPVYVPALDTQAVDVIVGPSRGFVWAEDPALNLQADVPSNAGRDIALVGGIFPAPRWADAFTTYTVAS